MRKDDHSVDVSDFTSWDEFSGLLEGVELEAKSAQGRDGKGSVPESVWDTYSSFANTSGGVILLGVDEEPDHSLHIIGIQSAEKVRREFIAMVNDTRKVSRNILRDHHIRVITASEKQIIAILVPPAARHERPIFVGLNPLEGSFRRIHDADIRCDAMTVKAMLADAIFEDRTAGVVENYTLDDLDMTTVDLYRQRLHIAVGADHHLLALPLSDLLRELGAALLDRKDAVLRPTIAGLILFGKHASLTERLPYFHLDYREVDPLAPKAERYMDRLVWDGSWPGNVFDFYERVSRKLYASAPAAFSLNTDMQREDGRRVRTALREALANALIHADYDLPRGIVVIQSGNSLTIQNPGIMRVPLEIAREGGSSDCRNAKIQQMFRLVGIVEQIGSGVPYIFNTWQDNCWKNPDYRMTFEPDRTELNLRIEDFLPASHAAQLQKLGPAYERMDRMERTALGDALAGRLLTNRTLRMQTGRHSADITRALQGLVHGGFLIRVGKTTSASYKPGPRLERAHRSVQAQAPTTKVSDRDVRLSDPIEKVRNSAYVDRDDVTAAIIEICRTPRSVNDIAASLRRNRDYVRQIVVDLVDESRLRREHASPTHPRQRYITV